MIIINRVIICRIEKIIIFLSEKNSIMNGLIYLNHFDKSSLSESLFISIASSRISAPGSRIQIK
jgi:hypothetical protein